MTAAIIESEAPAVRACPAALRPGTLVSLRKVAMSSGTNSSSTRTAFAKKAFERMCADDPELRARATKMRERKEAGDFQTEIKRQREEGMEKRKRKEEMKMKSKNRRGKEEDEDEEAPIPKSAPRVRKGASAT